MSESELRFGFHCQVSDENGKLSYGEYFVSRAGARKQLDVTPPPAFRSVIFDILQEYTYYGGSLNVQHTASYVHLEKPREYDLVCLDVALLEPEHNIDTRRAIVPATYGLYEGKKSGEKTYFYGDINKSVILANWNNNEPIKLLPNSSADIPPHWSQYAGIVDLIFAVSQNGDSFEFKGDFVVRRHLLGEFAGVALVPKYPGSGGLPKHALVAANWVRGEDNHVLCASQKAIDNLTELSRLLEYRGPQTTWVFGAPGSGKEVFAQALHAGSVVSREKHLRTRSVAGVKLEEFNRRLFASQTGESCLIEQVDGGGTLFLDEFDKLNVDDRKAICSTLLRVLEADEYIRVFVDRSGRVGETVAKISEVNWVFAGAFSTSRREDIPKDFWSRLTGKLWIQHPIEGSRGYSATLFIYFYVTEAIRRLGSRHGIDIDLFVELLEKSKGARRFNEQVTASLLGVSDSGLPKNERFMPPGLLLGMAEKFSALVQVGEGEDKNGRSVDSSRGIRQAARAAFFAMRQAAIEEEGAFDFDVACEKALRSAKETLKISRGFSEAE